MKLQQKIVLISFVFVLIIGSLTAFLNRSDNTNDFFVILGMTGFFAGLLQLVVGLFLLFLKNKRYAQGCLISGGLLMLIGFATCSANFSLNLH